VSARTTPALRNAAALALNGAPHDDFDWLAILARELRSPLSGIRSAVEVLEHAGNLPGASDRARMNIARQAGQLSTLVEDLLDFASAAKGALEIHRKRLDVRAVVAMAVESCQWSLSASGRMLSLRLPSREMHLYADPDRLAHVVVNLLENAARSTQPFGCIDLILEHVGCDIELRVEDDGIGIRAEALSQVFGSPEQSPNSFGSPQGCGIGLMLTKHIVELHGGTIQAYSDGLRGGSSVVVRLPVASTGGCALMRKP
jgi:two-component system, sensor histidine kinase